MEKRGIKFLFFLIAVLFVVQFNVRQVQAEGDIKITSSSNGNFSNLVVYVDFSDTDHEHGDLSWGSCFLDNPMIDELFDGDSKPRSLTQYLKTISYGDLIVSNIFPQYDQEKGKITPYELANTAEYYAGNHYALITEVIQYLNASGKLSGVSLDEYKDNYLDNLMIVVPCESGTSNTLFYGLSSSYNGTEQVNGVSVSHYNIVTESGAYLGISGSGLLIHEFMHTLGYYDLYRNASSDGTAYTPVGSWDIMSVESYRVQYPLAYYRSAISGWFDIPTVTSSQQSYSLVAASSSTSATKNDQAVILKTSHSDTEFFVLEYRKKGDTYDVSEDNKVSYSDTSLDASIYGSGLIIYRINTDQTSNRAGGKWAAYVFRPEDTYYTDGVERASNTHILESYLSSDSGRTSYGVADLTKGLTDGAITYSDGTNSGIVISNVGSAAGDYLTFDITFTEPEAGDKSDWTLLTDGRADEYTTMVGSFMDSDGTIYCVEADGGSTPGIYSFDGSTWTKVCDAPSGTGMLSYQLGIYSNTLYCAYADSSYYLHLVKRSGDSWSEVMKSTMAVNEFSLSADAYGLILTFVDNGENGTRNSLYAYIMNASGNTAYTIQNLSTYSSNICTTIIDGTPYLAYREYQNNGRITVYRFTSGKWQSVGSPCTASAFDLTSDGQILYLFASSGSAGYLYTYDMSQASPSWKQSGTFSDASAYIVNACISNGIPYVFYAEGASPYTTRVKGYANGTWTEIGSSVSTGNTNGMALYGKDETLYAVYCRSSSNKVYIKKHAMLIVQDASTAITVTLPDGYTPKLYIDGIEYETTYDSTTNTCVADCGSKSAKVVTAYKQNEAGSPQSMYVWTLSYQGTSYQATPLPSFENIIGYEGFSARITGTTGLRYKSSISRSLKKSLLQTGGVDGYMLKEYGVIAIPKSYISDYPLIYNGTEVRGTVDFKVNTDGTSTEKTLNSDDTYDYFTGLLINIPVSGYKTEVFFRSYVILEKNGVQYIIYQLPLARNLYYIAERYLESNRYAVGTDEYTYLTQIVTDAD